MKFIKFPIDFYVMNYKNLFSSKLCSNVQYTLGFILYVFSRAKLI